MYNISIHRLTRLCVDQFCNSCTELHAPGHRQRRQTESRYTNMESGLTTANVSLGHTHFFNHSNFSFLKLVFTKLKFPTHWEGIKKILKL